MRRLINKLFIIVAFAALGAPASALASAGEVIRDCAEDGTLEGDYSARELRRALSDLPTDIDEYTGCREAIATAQTDLRKSGGRRVPRSGDGAAGPTANHPEDVAALAEATRGASGDKAPQLSIGGQRIVPGAGGILRATKTATDLPLPVLAALLAIGALGLAGGYLLTRRRWPEARRIALRVFRR